MTKQLTDHSERTGHSAVHKSGGFASHQVKETERIKESEKVKEPERTKESERKMVKENTPQKT